MSRTAPDPCPCGLAADYAACCGRFHAGDAAPDWLTPAFVAAVQAHLRRLLGAWRAVPYGQTLHLTW